MREPRALEKGADLRQPRLPDARAPLGTPARPSLNIRLRHGHQRKAPRRAPSALPPAPPTAPPTAPAATPTVRARILEAARVELSAHGRAAGVRDIARRAGVTAAMINYYFGGKGALYDAVVTEAQEGLAARIAEALASRGARGRAADVAGEVAGAYFDFLAEDRLLQRLFLREALERGDGVDELGRRFVARCGRCSSRTSAGATRWCSSRSACSEPSRATSSTSRSCRPLGGRPLGEGALARRRAHVVTLARELARLAEGPARPEARRGEPPRRPRERPHERAHERAHGRAHERAHGRAHERARGRAHERAHERAPARPPARASSSPPAS
jgi:AcrR family transcriptional regulator